jgi:hypothetical protein
MDPIAIAAVAGLAYYGRKLSYEKHTKLRASYKIGLEPGQNTVPVTDDTSANRSRQMLQQSGVTAQVNTNSGINFITPETVERNLGFTPQRKTEIQSLSHVAPDASREINGTAVQDFRGRESEYISGVMNGVSPVVKQNVGRGLGLDPSVPAAGGFHQGYRILQNNPNDERLNNLPGLTPPGAPIIPSGPLSSNRSGYNEPPIDTTMPTRDPFMPGSGFASSQQNFPIVPRSEFTRSDLPTLKEGLVGPVPQGIPYIQVAPSYDPSTAGVFSGQSTIRGTQEVTRMLPGSLPVVTAVPSDLTKVRNRNTQPNDGGPMSLTSAQQYVPLGMITKDNKTSQMNPLGTQDYLNTSMNLALTNPLVIRPFGS